MNLTNGVATRHIGVNPPTTFHIRYQPSPSPNLPRCIDIRVAALAMNITLIPSSPSSSLLAVDTTLSSLVLTTLPPLMNDVPADFLLNPFTVYGTRRVAFTCFNGDAARSQGPAHQPVLGWRARECRAWEGPDQPFAPLDVKSGLGPLATLIATFVAGVVARRQADHRVISGGMPQEG